jgi:uncharacterized phiE125 gp8 family phage protein
MIIYSSMPWYRGFLEQRSLRVVTPPSEEPITLAQARQHLRLDTYGSPESHPDDTMLEDIYIPAARAMCEAISGRAFVPAVYERGVNGFPYSYVAYDRNGISLGIAPVRGVTSVIYSDGTSDLTMDPANYVVDPYTDGGYIYPAYGTTWPVAVLTPNAVRVRFSAGYDPNDGVSPYEFVMPAQYRHAVLLALGHIYENRESTSTLNLNEIPMGLRWALEPSSLVNGFA